MSKAVCLLLALILLAGCKPKPLVSTIIQDPSVDLAISNLNERVSFLEAKNDDRATIDPNSRAYQKLETSFGVLLVSTKSVTPYLDGYKIKVAIGNPYNVSFKGFELEIWKFIPPPLSSKDKHTLGSNSGAPPETLPDFTKPLWERVRDENRTEILQPGSWNEVEFTVTPATPDEIRRLQMSVHLNEVQLNDDSSN